MKRTVKIAAIIAAVLLALYIIVQTVLYSMYGVNMKYKYGRNIRALVDKDAKITLNDRDSVRGIGFREWKVEFTDKNGREQFVKLRGTQYKDYLKESSRADVQLTEISNTLGYAGSNVIAGEIYDKYIVGSDLATQLDGRPDCGRLDTFPQDNVKALIVAQNFMLSGDISTDKDREYRKKFLKGKCGTKIKDVDLASALTSEEYFVTINIYINEADENSDKAEKYKVFMENTVNDILAKYGKITNASFNVVVDSEPVMSRNFKHGESVEELVSTLDAQELRESAYAKQ